MLDEKMNEFLRRNKDLFSNKREFLTKLREVRQKLMNKQQQPTNHSTTLTTTTTKINNYTNGTAEHALAAHSTSTVAGATSGGAGSETALSALLAVDLSGVMVKDVPSQLNSSHETHTPPHNNMIVPSSVISSIGERESSTSKHQLTPPHQSTALDTKDERASVAVAMSMNGGGQELS